MPWNAGWPSGKPIRPPPGAGVAQTGSRLALGQLDRDVPGSRRVHVGPHYQHRGRRRLEPRREVPDQRRVGGRPARDRPARLVRQRLRIHLGGPVVHRDRHEHRTLWRQRGQMSSARERMRHVLRTWRLVAPLHQWVRHPGRVAVGEVRLEGHQRPGLLAGRHEQGRMVRLGVEDGAHPVSDPRCRMEVDVGRGPAGLCEPVRHADGHCLLKAEHIAEVVGQLGKHRQLGRARVAEDRRHPALAE